MHILLYQLLLETVHTLLYIWDAVVHLAWNLNGTSKKIYTTMQGDSREPAQVLKVIWKNPFVFQPTPQTFFTVHERFAPVNIVLNNRVHLLSVNSKNATFVEANGDILDVRKHPLMLLPQTTHAVRLINLPIKVFYDLVDNLDVKDRNVVWLFHTNRCGSTAWAQVFHSLPGWTVFSEPQAMWYSVTYGDHGYHSAESFSKSEEYKRLAVAVIKLHIRHAPPGGSVFYKATISDEYLVETISEYFPHHKMLAAYRDALPTLNSFYRSFCNSTLLRYTAEVVLNHDPSDDKWWFHIQNVKGFTNGFDHLFCKRVITEIRPKTILEWFCFLWAAKAATIRSTIQNGAVIKPVKYESLQRDRRDTVAKVFDHLDIPADLVDVACETLNYDSQAGVTDASWENRSSGDASAWIQNEELVKKCNMILRALDFLDVNNSFDLPNSI